MLATKMEGVLGVRPSWNAHMLIDATLLHFIIGCETKSKVIKYHVARIQIIGGIGFSPCARYTRTNLLYVT